MLNSGTGVRTSLVELAGLAADAAPVPDAGIVHVEVHRAGDIEHACADLTRLTAVGAPLPVHSTAQAVDDFVRASWDRPGVRRAPGTTPSASSRSVGSPREVLGSARPATRTARKSPSRRCRTGRAGMMAG